MNVLFITKDSKVNMVTWQKFHFAEEVKAAGHEPYFVSINDNIESITRLLERCKIDILVSGISDDIYLMKIIAVMDSCKNAFKILACYDNLQSTRNYLRLISYFDRVWLTSKENYNYFSSIHSDVMFQPYASRALDFHSVKDKHNSICFLGTPYGYRLRLLNEIARAEVPVSVYSSALSKSESSIVGEKVNFKALRSLEVSSISFKMLVAKLYAALFGENKIDSKIELFDSPDFGRMKSVYSSHRYALNSLELRNTGYLPTPVLKIHLRTFEIPMCSGLQIARRCDEITDYFTDGKEILLYDTIDELINIIKDYSKPHLIGNLEEIRFNGHQRAMRDHRWSHRFTKLFEI